MKTEKMDIKQIFIKKDMLRHALSLIEEHPEELRGLMARIRTDEDTVSYVFAVKVKRKHELIRALRI